MFTTVSGMRSYLLTQRFLHIAQVEPNQSVSKENCGDSTSAAKAMDGCFANLKHFSIAAGGQIISALSLAVPAHQTPKFRVVFGDLVAIFLHRFK